MLKRQPEALLLLKKMGSIAGKEIKELVEEILRHTKTNKVICLNCNILRCYNEQKKKITIKPTFKLRDVDKALDNWVNDTTNNTDYNESKTFNHSLKDNVSRFTIQIPDFLHRRIKSCAPLRESQ